MSITAKHRYATICAFICWFAIVCQFVLMLQNRVVAVPETVVRFFSFFTILTNILVAVCFTANSHNKSWGSFFRRPATITALLVYIIVVGVVYNLVLRGIWSPTGLQKLVDELLHLLVPLLFLAFWIVFTTKEIISWNTVFKWLIYPSVYLVFILTSGRLTSFYPYPFVDVQKLGIAAVLMNSLYLLMFFTVLAALLIFASRRWAAKRSA